VGAEPPREPGDLLHVGVELGVAFTQEPQQHVAPLRARRLAQEGLLGIQALIGDAQRLGGVARLLAQQYLAVASADREALAALQQRACQLGGDLLRFARRLRARRLREGGLLRPACEPDEGAELVAAESVGASRALGALGEPAPEARQQSVAGWVAEGVVVALEPVEVEEQHQLRCGRGRVGRFAREVRQQRAPVAKARERVAIGQLGARRDQAQVLARRRQQPCQHRHERRRGEPRQSASDALDAPVHEDADRDQPA
jgi:hypothetical protein